MTAFPRLYTLKEAGIIMGGEGKPKHPETVRQMCKRGDIAYIQRPGCGIRISEKDLEEYLSRWRVPASRHGSADEPTAQAGGSSTAANDFRQEQRIERKLRRRSLGTSPAGTAPDDPHA